VAQEQLAEYADQKFEEKKTLLSQAEAMRSAVQGTTPELQSHLDRLFQTLNDDLDEAKAFATQQRAEADAASKALKQQKVSFTEVEA
jgi:hypothetical protein